MRIFFDTNVVLDILLKRPGFAETALALARTNDPWLSTLSLANICYILGRSKSALIAAPLEFMRSKFHLSSLAGDTVDRAVALGFEDFEDALQFASAEACGASFLVTRNVADFRSTENVSVVLPAGLLEQLP